MKKARVPALLRLHSGRRLKLRAGEVGKVAKAASAQGTLGFSGDSGRMGLNKNGSVRPWLRLAQFIRSRGFHFRPRKKSSWLSAHLAIAAETARSADSHLLDSYSSSTLFLGWGLSLSPDRCVWASPDRPPLAFLWEYSS